jgi:hypothetical protein
MTPAIDWNGFDESVEVFVVFFEEMVVTLVAFACWIEADEDDARETAAGTGAGLDVFSGLAGHPEEHHVIETIDVDAVTDHVRRGDGVVSVTDVVWWVF